MELDSTQTLANIFLALNDKAVSTSSDVKTLLTKIDEMIEKTKECSSRDTELDENLPRSCLELRNKGHTMSGVYKIYVVGLRKSIEVCLCYILLFYTFKTSDSQEENG